MIANHKLFYFILFLTSSSLSLASNKASFPILDKVGIIPPSVEESYANSINLEEAFDVMKKEVFTSLKESKRFFVINDELVRTLWERKEGRNILLEDNELTAFVSFTFLPKPDSVMMLARVLDPNLKILLQESDTVAREELRKASENDQKALVRSLIFRLLNRLPIDSYVKSIQGSVVTLQGGKNQGLVLGQEFTVSRIEISEISTGTEEWSQFKSFPRGRVKIIETEEMSSVAQILAQEFDNSIQVGNGFVIPSLMNRHYFQSADSPSMIANPAQDTPPVGLEEILTSPKPIPEEPTTTPAVAKAQPPPPAEPGTTPPPKLDLTPPPKKELAPSVLYQEKTQEPESSKLGHFGLTLLYGYSDWELSGELEDASEFHPLPLGLGLALEGPFFTDFLGFEVSGEFEQGSLRSKQNAVTLLEGKAKLFYEMKPIDPFTLHLGLEGRWFNLQATEDHFGGLWLGDLGVYSTLSWRSVISADTPLDFALQGGLSPTTFGGVSYGSDEVALVGGMGWNTKLAVKWGSPLWMRLHPGIEGGYSYKYLLDSNEAESDLNQYSLKLFVQADL